jgi:polyferredoxin
MDKMNYPRGLIRFATQNGLASHWSHAEMMKRVFRPRVLVYSTVLFAIVTALGASLALRSPFRVDVIRDRGALARQVEDGRIENVYRLQVMNASESPQRFRVAVAGLAGATLVAGAEVEVGATEARWLPVSVQIPPEAARAMGAGAHPMRFEITRVAEGPEAKATTEKSTFVVPR